jgi:hypothetical protein
MFRASIANHQQVRCMYFANATSDMAVSEPGWSGTPSRLADSYLRSTICYIFAHKVSVHLMITTQKVTSNVQSVPRQSPDIY